MCCPISYIVLLEYFEILSFYTETANARENWWFIDRNVSLNVYVAKLLILKTQWITGGENPQNWDASPHFPKHKQ